jgi:ribonucleoside-diphosphate reductase beta chain
MIFDTREVLKPYEYPVFFEAFRLQTQMRWTPEEVSLADDIRDWNLSFTDAQKHFCTHIFRNFTQSDIDIAGLYLDYYLPKFKLPEIRMMLAQFAATEAVHIHAYSHLIDSVGMPPTEYNLFLDNPILKEKHRLLLTEYEDIQHTILSKTVFGEGLQLFAAFAMLLNFPRHGHMKGMGQIVTWSIRDESLHVESLIKLLKTIQKEKREYILEVSARSLLEEVVALEDAFIDLAFELGPMEDLTADQTKQYIRYIGDLRMSQLGFNPRYGVDNPLPWIEDMLENVEHSNFFETTATEYGTGSLTGSWEGGYD